MKDFYFVYGYDKDKNFALRMYRCINGSFERYDLKTNEWIPSPEQSRILVGEDWDYEEISENEANQIKEMLVA